MSIEAVAAVQPGLAQPAQKTRTDKTAGKSFSDILQSAVSGSGTTDLDAVFEKASQTYGVPVALLKAVAKTESNFNPNAQSSCGAQGVMQLMPGTARGLGVTDSFDPEQNIMGGAKYLSGLLSMFDGNTTYAVAAYNAGAGNVQKYGGVPPFAETQAYVERVLENCGQSIQAGTVSTNSSGTQSGSLLDAAGGSTGLGTSGLSFDGFNFDLLMSMQQYKLQSMLLDNADSQSTYSF